MLSASPGSATVVSTILTVETIPHDPDVPTAECSLTSSSLTDLYEPAVDTDADFAEIDLVELTKDADPESSPQVNPVASAAASIEARDCPTCDPAIEMEADPELLALSQAELGDGMAGQLVETLHAGQGPPVIIVLNDPATVFLAELEGAIAGLISGLEELAAWAQELGSQAIAGVRDVLVTPLNEDNPDLLRTLGLGGVNIVEEGIYRVVIEGSIFEVTAGAAHGITTAAELAQALASRIAGEHEFVAEAVGNTLRLLPGNADDGTRGVGNLPISISSLQDQGIFSQILPLIDSQGFFDSESLDPSRALDIPEFAYGSITEMIGFGDLITNRVVNPIRDFLSSSPAATLQDLLNHLATLGHSIPGADFVINPEEIVGAYVQDLVEDRDELVITLPFSFSRSLSYDLDIGRYAEMRGMSLAAQASGALSLSVEAAAELTFGFDLRPGVPTAERFFLRFGEDGEFFSINLTGEVSDLDIELLVGPVRGAVEGGSGTLEFALAFGFASERLNERGNLTAATLLESRGQLAGFLNVPSPSAAAFDLSLPVSIDFEGIQLPGQNPVFRIHSENFLDGLPQVEFNDFDRLFDFTSLTPQGILDLFRTFSELLPRMLNAPDFQLRLPFAGEVDIGRVLNMVGTFAEGFLDRLTDEDGEIRFPDIQTLLVVAQDIIAETGILQDFSFSYDAGERQLVFGFELSTEVLFDAEPFGFDFATGPISLGISNSTFQLSGSAGLVFELGVDLTGPRASLAGEAGFALPGNGVLGSAAEVEILLEGGAVTEGRTVTFTVAPNSGNTSLDDLADDINAAIATTILAGQIVARIEDGRVVFESDYSGPAPNFLVRAPSLLGFATARYAVEPPGASVTLREFRAHAAVALEASGLQASATLGFLDILIGGGEANFGFDIELDFTPDGPRDFLALFDSLLTDPAALLPELNFNVSAGHLALRQIRVGSGILDAPSIEAEIRIGLREGFNFPDDLSDPDAFEVVFDGNFDELLAFRNIGLEQILDMIFQLAERIAEMTNLAIFQVELPVINTSISDILDFANTLLSAREQIMETGAGSIQRLRDLLHTTLRDLLEPLVANIEALQLVTDVDFIDNILRLDVRFEAGIEREFPFAVDLGSHIGNLVDLGGSVDLKLDVLAIADLRVGLDLTNPLSPVFLVFEGTELALEVLLAADDIAFAAAIGPVGLFLGPGFVRLHDPDPDKERGALRLAVVPDSGTSVPVADLLDAFEFTVTGAFQVELPLYFPNRNEANLLGTLEIFFNLGDFDDDFVLEFDLDIDFEDFFQSLDLFATLGDGLELFFMAVEVLMQGELFGIQLPFIGDQLKDIASFILEIRDGIRSAFDSIQEPSEANIQAALLFVFGPEGLDILPDDLLPEEIDVTLVMDGEIIDGVEVRIDFNGSVTLVDSDLVFDIGLPALGLALDAGLDIEFEWSWTLGFGVTRSDGFYLLADADNAEIELSLTAGLAEGSAMTGGLGILYFSATVRDEDGEGEPLHTGVMLELSLNFMPDSSGKLQMSQILSGNGLDIRLEGVATMHLELEVGFARLSGERLDALPSFLVDFDLTWNLFTLSLADGASLGDAPDVGFTNMRLDLGTFFHDYLYPIIEQINQYLEPLRPVINFLTADITVLSWNPLRQIFDADGDGKVTVLDLAELFGAISSGTRNFIETVITVMEILDMFTVDGGLPGRDERLLIPLGDFDFSSLNLDLRSDDLRSVTLNESMFSGVDFGDALEEYTSDSVQSTFGKLSDSEFEFLLIQPANLIRLLLGQDVEFFRYTTPEVGLSFSFVKSIVIYSPPTVKLVLTAGVGFTAQIGFGYDSSGIRRFLETKNVGDIFGGFYIMAGRDKPLLTFWGEVGGGASVSMVIGVSAMVTVRIEVAISLYDPGNGKLYFRQIADMVRQHGLGPALDCMFEVSLSVFGQVQIRIFLDVVIGEVTLWSKTLGPFYFLGPIVKEGGACFQGNFPDRLEKETDGAASNDMLSTASPIGFAPGIHLRGASISRPGDVDWYSFELPKEDEIIIELRGDSEMELSLYDEGGNILQVVDAGGAPVKRLRSGPLAAGLYFLKIWDPDSEVSATYELDILPGANSATTIYYVASGLANNRREHSFYALAEGDDSHDDAGATPQRPAATVARIFELHDVQPGDLILVDTGTYTESLIFGAQANGVFILGTPTQAYDDLSEDVVFGTVFSADGAAPVITISEATNITVGGLIMEDGETAVSIIDSTGIVLGHSVIRNFDTGVLGEGATVNTWIRYVEFEQVIHGVDLESANFSRLEDLSFTGALATVSTGQGDRLTYQGTAIRVSGNHIIIDDADIENYERGVVASNVDQFVLSGLTATGVIEALVISDSGSASVSRVTVTAIPADLSASEYTFAGFGPVGVDADSVTSLSLSQITYNGHPEEGDAHPAVAYHGVRLVDVTEFAGSNVRVNRAESGLTAVGGDTFSLSGGRFSGPVLVEAATSIIMGVNIGIERMGEAELTLTAPDITLQSSQVRGVVATLEGTGAVMVSGSTFEDADATVLQRSGQNWSAVPAPAITRLDVVAGDATLQNNTLRANTTVTADGPVVMSGNTVEDISVLVDSGDDVTVQNSSFSGSTLDVESGGGGALTNVTWTATHVTWDASGALAMSGNTATGSSFFIENAGATTITNNSVTGGYLETLRVNGVGTGTVTATGNTIIDTRMLVRNSTGVIVTTGNWFENGGLVIEDSSNLEISGNDFVDGSIGISMLRVVDGIIEDNTFTGAVVAVRLGGSVDQLAEDIRIEDNRLQGSTNTGIHIFNTHVNGIEIIENVIEGYAQYGVHAVGHADLVGNEIRDNEVGVRVLSPLPGLWDNEIHGNTTGLTGPGFLGNNSRSADRHNRIHGNTTGVLAENGAVIAFNRVFDNETGIRAASGTLIRHNIVYRNEGASIWVHGGSNNQIQNNTVYSPTGTYAVRVSGGAVNTDVRNNILWSEAGAVLSVEYMSDVGFQSDYNNLYASGTAVLGEWIKTYDDLLDWRIETRLDLNSIGTTRVHPLRDRPQFVDAEADDYRIQDAVGTTMNSGDPAFLFANEPGAGSNGLRINQGAYGDTALAAQSPSEYLRLLTPDLYIDWESSEPRRIVWESFGLDGNVTLEVHQEGGGWVATIVTIGLFNEPEGVIGQLPGQGSYFWSPNMSGVAANNDVRYSLRLTSGALTENSREVFTVPEVAAEAPTSLYLAADGDNRNPGTDPTAPKAIIYAFLQNYRLKANMTVHVAAGTYVHVRDVVISSTVALGGNEAFTLTGPAEGTALFDRTDTRSGTTGLIIDNANLMTIRRLSLTGGHRGVHVLNNSDFTTLEHLTLSGHSGVQIQVQGGSERTILQHLTITGGGSHGMVVEGVQDALRDNVVTGNAGTGIRLSGTSDLAITGNMVAENLGGGIWISNTVAETLTVIGNEDLAAGEGNILLNNAGNQIEAAGHVRIAGNIISRTPAHALYGTGRGVLAASNTILHNVISGHSTGIEMSAAGTIQGNRLVDNAVYGINLGSYSSTVIENVLEGGQYGAYSSASWVSGGNVFRNNVFFGQSVAGVHLAAGNNVVVESNTFRSTGGDAIRLLNTGVVAVRNNIFSLSGGGMALHLDIAAQAALTSDFNLFHLSSGAATGRWAGVVRSTFIIWRNASFLDPNSLSADPLFVNAATADGLKLRSDAGSYHSGALAPSSPAWDALPAWIDAELVMDGERSPAIDRGDDSLPYDNEPAPNGGFINMGAFANTHLASHSPTEYVLVLSPQGGETRPTGQQFEIRWRSHDTDGTVDILLRRDSEPEPVRTIASSSANSGTYLWTVDPDTPASDYRVEIVRPGDVTGSSVATFSITVAISVYYVNDDDVIADGYTTAAGDNANDGLTPGTPMASLGVLLQTYSFSPGDMIYVDAGTYDVSADIVLTAAMSGIVIRGFHDPDRSELTTILDRGNRNSGHRIFRIEGANGVTFEYLTLMDAHQAIFAGANAAHDITIRNNYFLTNGDAGVRIGANNTGLLVENNRFWGSSTSTVAGGGQLHGVRFEGTSAIIRGNEMVWDRNNWATGIYLDGSSTTQGIYLVEDNLVELSRNGIYAGTYNTGSVTLRNNVVEMYFSQAIGIQAFGAGLRVEGNEVFGASTGISMWGVGAVAIDNDVYSNITAGISLQNGAIAQGNRVFNNATGIIASSSSTVQLVLNNEVYNNTVRGLELIASVKAQGNHVYGNPAGIQISPSYSSTLHVTVVNNIVEDSSLRAMRIQGASVHIWVWNNTILQDGGEEAVWVESGGYVDLRNNVMVMSGTADGVRVANAAQAAVFENYNLYDLRGDGVLFHWGSAEFDDPQEWFFGTGNGARSMVADPLFTDEGAGDYTLSVASPGLNAGDPDSTWVHEIGGHGGRVDLGHTGNTVAATEGDTLFIDVMDPVATTRTAAGQAVEIVFLASGFGAGQTAAWLNVGRMPFQNWNLLLHAGSATQGTIFASTAVDLSGVVNPAPEPIYREYLYSSTGVGQRLDFMLDLPAGSYEARLHFVPMTWSANRFDIRVDGVTLVANYDPYAAAGSTYTAVTRDIAFVSDEDGVQLSLVSTAGYAYLSAIEIVRLYDDAPAASFTVEASSDDGGTWETIATGVGVDLRGIGRLHWTPEVAAAHARVRVVAEAVPSVSGVSPAFLVAPAGNLYYVNDGAMDHNVFTTAPGDNSHHGKDPAAPMASLVALLSAYTFMPGDIIMVDTGTYLIPRNLVLAAAESGITIRGAYDPDNPSSVTVLDRDNRTAGSYIFDIQGAENVTLEHMTLQNAERAVNGGSDAAHGLTVRHNTFINNGDSAVRVGSLNTGMLVEHNTFSGIAGLAAVGGQIYAVHFEGLSAVIANNHMSWTPNSGWAYAVYVRPTSSTDEVDLRIENNMISGSRVGIEAYISNNGSVLIRSNTIEAWHSQGSGINVGGSATRVDDNVVTGGQYGILASSNTSLTGNDVSAATGAGISLASGAGAFGNTVHGNVVGILTSNSSTVMWVVDNHVYNNTAAGIRFHGIAEIRENLIHNNGIGLQVTTNSASHSRLLNNTVYGNDTAALHIDSGTSTASMGLWLHNNTLYQSGPGTFTIRAISTAALDIRNNIIGSDGGTALRVETYALAGIHENYNLYHILSDGMAFNWNGVDLSSVQDWFFVTAQGSHSFLADPLLVNPGAGDYAVQAGSPVVDAGDPATAWIHEPQPNGGRVNIGAAGNTAAALTSTTSSLVVSNVTELSKAITGRPFTIEFLASGYSEGQSAFWGNVASLPVGAWFPVLPSNPHTTSSILAVTPIDLSGVSRPAPEAVYRQFAYSTVSWAPSMDFNLNLPDGAYRLRLHFITDSPLTTQNIHIDVDGVRMRTGYNILAEAGGVNRAVVEEIDVVVSGGQLLLSLVPVGISDNVRISGIEVMSLTAPTVSGPFTVDVSMDGGDTFAVVATGVTLDERGMGQVLWTPSAPTDGREAVVRVRSQGADGRTALSAAFLVANPGNRFYINNDSTENSVHTTAVGHNLNTGKTPDQPLPSLEALFASYRLQPGDQVYIDTGVYTLSRNVRLTSEFNGVTFIGAHDPANPLAVTVLDRAQYGTGFHAIDIIGAQNLTFRHLQITGGHIGVEVVAVSAASMGSDQLLFENVRFFHNTWAGLRIGNFNHAVEVVGSTFEGLEQTWNSVTRQNTGILSTAHSLVVRDSVFDLNYSTGIDINASSISGGSYLFEGVTLSRSATGLRGGTGNWVLTDSWVIDNREYGVLISVSSNGVPVVSGNIIEGNGFLLSGGLGAGVSITATAVVEDNIIEGNNIGVRVSSSARILSNEIRLNERGIRIDYWGTDELLVADNRIFGQTEEGVLIIRGHAHLTRNQIYSNRVGVAKTGTHAFAGIIENNILYDHADKAISVVTGGTVFRVANNTIYESAGIGIELHNTSAARVINNIIQVNAGFGILVSGTANNIVSDYNLFYNTGADTARVGQWGATQYTTLADWQAGTSRDADSLFADPRFFDRDGADDVLGYREVDGFFIDGGLDDNYHLLKLSPAIDRGVTLWSPRTDFDQDARRDDPGTESVGGERYIVEILPESLFDADRGVAQGWTWSYSLRTVNIGFTFTYFGVEYTQLQLSMSGLLGFPTASTSSWNSLDTLLDNRWIAPLWGDVNVGSTGRDVFIDNSVEGELYIRFNARLGFTTSDVHFAVLLSADGSIRFDYGTVSGPLSPTVGISLGNRVDYYLPDGYDSDIALNHAHSVLLTTGVGITDIGAFEFKGDSNDDTPPLTLGADPVAIEEEGELYALIDSFALVFSEALDTIDARSAATFELIRDADGNGEFDGSDEYFRLVPIYDADEFRITLHAEAGVLPAGDYRLRVFSANLRDVSGNELDGDGDGLPGGDYIRFFSVSHPPAEILEVVINDGAVQRSMVTEIRVAFDRDLSAEATPEAFVIVNLDTGILLDPATVSLTWDADAHAAVLQFPGLPGGSLPDGNYSLVINAADFVAGSGLDANGDGVAGGAFEFDFHRLFGDTTGNGYLDTLDLVRFRRAYGAYAGQSAYVAAFDADSDTSIGVEERDLILANRSVPPPDPAPSGMEIEPASTGLMVYSPSASDSELSPYSPVPHSSMSFSVDTILAEFYATQNRPDLALQRPSLRLDASEREDGVGIKIML